ncbi:ABC-type transport auxiliary lipoprotein family protein [Amaricoccus tamworthensis]|uniref:ABC-type transport auxiliary lipoprotein family protein n=1 Tax=Amaricoccus tamworthensis TaxID=57002 RepID=UPI003C7B815D
MRRVFLRTIAALALGAALTGCETVASLDDASRTLDTYELSPVSAAGGVSSRARGVVFVDEPLSAASLSTDRIVVKPDRLSVAYLSDARWTDRAPLHLQWLLVRSLAGSGQFAHVTSRTVGPLSDFTLLTDIDEFEAQVVPDGVTVVVRLRFTLVRDSNATVMAARTIERRVPVASDESPDVVRAFDAAMTGALEEVVSWASRTARGSGGA